MNRCRGRPDERRRHEEHADAIGHRGVGAGVAHERSAAFEGNRRRQLLENGREAVGSKRL
jgi:hypothetical protein